MSERVQVHVPGEATLLTTPTGDVQSVALDEDGRRFVMMRVEDARMIINSGAPSCLAWRELNPDLIEALGPVPPPAPGINIARYQAAERAAMKPQSIQELTAALRGSVADTLRMIRRN
jgi:hypothetical protein